MTARKVAEKEGQKIAKSEPGPNGKGVQVNVGSILDYGFSQGPMISPFVATFDGSKMVSQGILLAAIRFPYLTPLTEKLQSPQHVLPTYVGYGGDSVKDGVIEQLSPVFTQIRDWTQRNEKEGRFIQNGREEKKEKKNNSDLSLGPESDDGRHWSRGGGAHHLQVLSLL